jgi:hypothetical protein
MTDQPQPQPEPQAQPNPEQLRGNQLAKADVPLDEAPMTFRMLKEITKTQFVPRAIRESAQPEMVAMAAIMMGRELGLGPMQAMIKIDVIDGRPAPSAELVVALIRSAGHSVTLVSEDRTQVTVLGERTDGDAMQVTFTWEEASRIPATRKDPNKKLTDKQVWKSYPQDMMWARAVTRLARRLFPDVLTAVRAYTPDELGAEDYHPDRREVDPHGWDDILDIDAQPIQGEDGPEPDLSEATEDELFEQLADDPFDGITPEDDERPLIAPETDAPESVPDDVVEAEVVPIGPDEPTPGDADVIDLATCQFQQGKAPNWRVLLGHILARFEPANYPRPGGMKELKHHIKIIAGLAYTLGVVTDKDIPEGFLARMEQDDLLRKAKNYEFEIGGIRVAAHMAWHYWMVSKTGHRMTSQLKRDELEKLGHNIALVVRTRLDEQGGAA